MTAPPARLPALPPPAPTPAPTSCPPGRCSASDLCPEGPTRPANERILPTTCPHTPHDGRLRSASSSPGSAPPRPTRKLRRLGVWLSGFCRYLQPRPFPRLSNPDCALGRGRGHGTKPSQEPAASRPPSRSAITFGVCSWCPAAAEGRLYGVGFLGAYRRFSGTAAVL